MHCVGNLFVFCLSETCEVVSCMYLQYCENVCILLFAVYIDFVPISECVRAVDSAQVVEVVSSSSIDGQYDSNNGHSI